MLRIYPDVVVRFRVEATLSDSPTDTGTSEPEES
jgi:hypothetical protein